MNHDIELAPPHPSSETQLAPRPSKDAMGAANVERGAASDAATEKRSGWRMTAIVFALFLSLFVAALDATIVATAAPTIAADLASAAGYTWIGAAYLLASAVAGPIWAKLSDIWGRKLIVLLALALFFASSAVCATARSMETLIVGRAFQGVSGGGLILLVHVCISDLFSLRQRSLLMGFTEGIWAVAGGVGPILGGVFASLVSPCTVYINLPIIGVASILVVLYLDVRHEHTSFTDGIRAVDWTGIATYLGFSLMILLGLNFGGAVFPWSSAKVIALLVVGSVFIGAFIYSEARIAKYPLIPLQLFKKRTNIATLSVVFFHGFVFIAAEYYMPLYLQSVLELNPLKSGLMLLPFIVPGASAGVLCGIFIHRTGHFRPIIYLGSLLLCLGFGLFISLGPSTSIARAIIFFIIGGIGSGLLFEAPLIAIQTQVEQHDVATATSTLSFIRHVALAISVVIGGTTFQNSMDGQKGMLVTAGLPQKYLDALSGEAAMANVMLPGHMEEAAWEMAAKTAFSRSMRNMWITYTVFAFLGVVAGVFVEHGHVGTEHVETVTGVRREKDGGDGAR